MITAPCAELQEGTATGTEAAGLRYTEINAVFLVWVLLVLIMEPGTGGKGPYDPGSRSSWFDPARDQHFHGGAHLPVKWELPLQEDLGTVHRTGRVCGRCSVCAGCQGQTDLKILASTLRYHGQTLPIVTR